MRRDGAAAKDYAQRHGVTRWYDDADALINDPEVNAVYIATPPGSHCDYTLRCAKAGKPVYVEKPMARNFEECQAMVTACRNVGTPLFVAYYRRAMPRFRKIQSLIESGALGRVHAVSVRLSCPPEGGEKNAQGDVSKLPWRVMPEVGGPGRLLDLGSHTLDFLDQLFGPIVQVGGESRNRAGLYPTPDLYAAQFAFVNGVLGSGLWCFCVGTSSWEDQVEILGEAAKLSFSVYGAEPLQLRTADGRVEAIHTPTPEHVQQPLIETIVEALRTNKPEICPSTGESAMRTNWVMDRILGEARWRS
jgi:predicted dehydrogenase